MLLHLYHEFDVKLRECMINVKVIIKTYSKHLRMYDAFTKFYDTFMIQVK